MFKTDRPRFKRASRFGVRTERVAKEKGGPEEVGKQKGPITTNVNIKSVKSIDG
jgi:hypothetical protein